MVMARLFLVLVLVGFAGCRDGSTPGRAPGPVAHDNGPPAPAVSGQDDALGPAGALAVVHGYYEAIDQGDYARAYRLWGGDGAASRQTFEEFRGGFAQTAHVEVETGKPGRIEGAAGSRYIEVPVSISAVTRDGTKQRFEGTYVLRRTVVDGASPEQRAWHLDSARIHVVRPASSK